MVVSTPGSGLVFDNTYTANCTAQYEACIVAAEDQLESLISTSDTINVTFNEANSGNNGVALGNSSVGWNVSYASLRADLLKVAPNDVLPTTDPSGGANWYVPAAYARMLGLNSSTESPDLSVTLNTYYGWDFGQDVINGLTHELSEGGLGRIGGLGGTAKGAGGSWGTMDLFRYNSAGKADYTNGRDGQTTYFSSNGGLTLSNGSKGAPTLSYNNQFNADGTLNNSGDTADWVQQSVFGSAGTGETLALTQTELDVLQALGWKITLKQDVDANSGSWETPSNWSTGSMPIEPQDVYIKLAVVSLDSNVAVNSIATSSGGILEIGDKTPTQLTAVDATTLNTEDVSSVASGNLGEIFVYTDSTLQIGNGNFGSFGDVFDNAGTLTLGKGAGGSGYLDLTGSVNLTGGGKVVLGQTGSSGDILNASSTSGGSLINVNNTISGSGLIDLSTFDNQGAGVIQAQSDLRISAGTFTNEGGITAEASSRLDLGQDGVTQAIDNTGVVLVSAKADLQISGTYTASGSGHIYLKGAGAEITSDGAAATFVNANTIEADYTSQIGDSNLTFTNSGAVAVSFSGNTLTIDTGKNTVINTGQLAAGNAGTLAIDSNLNNENTLTAGGVSSGETSTGTVELGLDNHTGSAINTGVISVYGDSDLAIRGNYTVSGSGHIGFKGAGADITSDGLAPAKFTNASTIDAFTTGQIGDVGIESTNHLTFVNTGAVYASGSGVGLTINTGNLTINDAGGLLEAENHSYLFIESNVNTGVGGTIEAATGGFVTIDGALSGAGTLSAGSGSILEWVGGGSFAGAITGAGQVCIYGATTLDAGASLSVAYLIDDANLTLSGVSVTNAAGDVFSIEEDSGGTVTVKSTGTGSFTNAGSLRIDGYGTALISGPLIDQGTISVTSGILRVTGALSGNGSLATATGAETYLTGSGSFAGAISGSGTITLGGTTTLHAGATLSAADVIVTSELELAGVAVTNNAGHTFALTAAAASTATLASGTGGAFTNAGSLVANGAGTASISGSFTNSGTVSALGGTLSFLSVVGGTGALDVGKAGTLSLGLGASSGQTVNFLGTSGVLDLSNPLDFVGKIAGFGGADEIFLKKTAFTTFSFSNNLLTVKDGSTTVASLHINESSNHFSLTNETQGVLITFG